MSRIVAGLRRDSHAECVSTHGSASQLPAITDRCPWAREKPSSTTTRVSSWVYMVVITARLAYARHATTSSLMISSATPSAR